MAEDVAFVDEVAGDGLDAQGADAVEIGDDGLLALGGVLGEEHGGNGGRVDEGVVEDALIAGVLVDFFDVLGGGEADGLVGLGHEVADEDAGGAGFGDGLGDAVDEEIGDERGVEGAGAEGDEVGLGDGLEGFREGVGRDWLEHELDDALAAGGDIGFAVDEGTVVHAGDERDIGIGGWEDAPAGGENLRRHLDGLGEISGDVGERGDEEVAEAVAAELALLEAVLEELGEEVLVFGEGDHAVAEVAGGEHVEVFAETAGGAAVVGDGDDGGEVADDAGDGRGGLRLAVGG